MDWNEQSPGFWRSVGGRFDVIDNGTHAYAIDWNLGKTYTGDTVANAKAWCLIRAAEKV